MMDKDEENLYPQRNTIRLNKSIRIHVQRGILFAFYFILYENVEYILYGPVQCM